MARYGASIATLGLVVAACSASAMPSVVPASAPRGTDPTLTTEAPAASAVSHTELPAWATGTIAFMRKDPAGNWQPWTACADLSNARQLPTPKGHSAGWMAWSPDGSRIAFNANDEDASPTSEDEDTWDIYTMKPDGTDVRLLTRSVGLEGDPGWSPDGTRIAFDSTEPGKQGIWTMNAADGGDKRRIAVLPADATTDYGPRFSPDGRRIVFTRNSTENDAGLWTMSVDGSGLTRITPPSIAPWKADWAPDGSVILFDAVSSGFPNRSLWVVRPDGSGLRTLTLPPPAGHEDGFQDPAWSPDGTHIIAVHGSIDAGAFTGDGLATMDADGSDPTYLASGWGHEHKPAWTSAPCRP